MQREYTALDRSWNASKDGRLALSTVDQGCEARVRLGEKYGDFLLATRMMHDDRPLDNRLIG